MHLLGIPSCSSHLCISFKTASGCSAFERTRENPGFRYFLEHLDISRNTSRTISRRSSKSGCSPLSETPIPDPERMTITFPLATRLPSHIVKTTPPPSCSHEETMLSKTSNSIHSSHTFVNDSAFSLRETERFHFNSLRTQLSQTDDQNPVQASSEIRYTVSTCDHRFSTI